MSVYQRGNRQYSKQVIIYCISIGLNAQYLSMPFSNKFTECFDYLPFVWATRKLLFFIKRKNPFSLAKINYKWSKHSINLSEKGRLKATSICISFSQLFDLFLGRTIVSIIQTLQKESEKHAFLFSFVNFTDELSVSFCCFFALSFDNLI